jgi:hypothetical protein
VVQGCTHPFEGSIQSRTTSFALVFAAKCKRPTKIEKTSSSASGSSDSSVLLLGRNQQQQIKAEKEEVVLTIFQCSSPLH